MNFLINSQISRPAEDSLGDRISDGLVVTNVVIGQSSWLPPLIICGRLWAVNAVSLKAASKVLK
jgi:hypothetical protein